MKKTLITLLSLAPLAALMAQQTGEAKTSKREKYEFAKERSLSKTYPAAGNTLVIENSFGNVKFNRWEKNEIKVDVKIDVSANDEGVAQRTFDGITVTDKQDGKEVKFKTSHSKNGASCKKCKISMHVDYEVYLPASVPLDIENSFGNTELPDHTGTVSLTQKFGNLTTGKLGNTKKIRVEFGKADIKQTSGVKAVFKFSQIKIGSLSGQNDIEMEFCEKSTIGIDPSISGLTLSESYSNVNLKPSGPLSATYSVSTNFGHFVDRTSADIKRTDTPEKYGPDSKRKYEGKSGAGAAQIKLKSTFGTIVLGEPTAEDRNTGNNKKKKQVI